MPPPLAARERATTDRSGGVVPVTVWGQFADNVPILGGADRATVVSRFFTVVYLLFFLLMPWYTRWDRTRPVPDRVRS